MKSPKKAYKVCLEANGVLVFVDAVFETREEALNWTLKFEKDYGVRAVKWDIGVIYVQNPAQPA
jgi:hypothetical protein